MTYKLFAHETDLPPSYDYVVIRNTKELANVLSERGIPDTILLSNNQTSPLAYIVFAKAVVSETTEYAIRNNISISTQLKITAAPSPVAEENEERNTKHVLTFNANKHIRPHNLALSRFLTLSNRGFTHDEYLKLHTTILNNRPEGEITITKHVDTGVHFYVVGSTDAYQRFDEYITAGDNRREYCSAIAFLGGKDFDYYTQNTAWMIESDTINDGVESRLNYPLFFTHSKELAKRIFLELSRTDNNLEVNHGYSVYCYLSDEEYRISSYFTKDRTVFIKDKEGKAFEVPIYDVWHKRDYEKLNIKI